MSHANGHSKHGHHHADPANLMTPENTAFKPGALRGLGFALIVAGGAAMAASFFIGKADGLLAKQMIASYHVGFLTAMSICLGCLGFVMILHQTNAGWSALLRRIVEQVMSLTPFMALLLAPTLVLATVGGKPIWKWMDPSYVAGDPLYDWKAPYLNVNFFLVRAAIYFAVWIGLATALYAWSRRQDATGDKWLTAKARRLSAPGLLLFAVTTAFAGFDWGMSLDYHFFSTMWGVYFFAIGIGGAMAMVTLLAILVQGSGKLKGLVTEEHLHDMGKLMFAFTVFWAYIGFSQYFLIWYANIPEETSYMIRRAIGTWEPLSMAIAAGRFIVPFLVLMPRPFRRNRLILGAMCVWILAFTAADFFWQVRPQILDPEYNAVPFSWQDLVAMVGPIAVFAGLVAIRLTNGPLIPLKDPRLAESLHHKNYV